MKLYLLKRTDEVFYDEYDACVVCANSPTDAMSINPSGQPFDSEKQYSDWAISTGDIKCIELGEAAPQLQRGVVLASFNAG